MLFGFVPISIWINSAVDDTGYAAVTDENISQLQGAVAGLNQFPDSFADELSARLFRNAAADSG